MAEPATKMPVIREEKTASPAMGQQFWRPFEGLHREIDRLFDDFDRGFWRRPFRRSIFEMEPFGRREMSWIQAPAVDVVEKADRYEISADLPGMDQSKVEVKLVNGNLVIQGEKEEETKEEKKDYYVHERSFGSFERSFAVPDSADPDKIEASFKNGVLTVTLPKKPEARMPEKNIEVKPA